MNEASLLGILRKLGISEFKRQRSGWVDFRCPLAPWTHQHGTDRSMSAGAKIVDDGVSAWVCHACKHHGRIPNLIINLQRFRGEHYPNLLHEAEMADVTALFVTDYGDFERPAAAPVARPMNEAAARGLFPAASSVQDAADYLRGRNLALSTADDLGLLFDPEQRRVLFPVRDHQRMLWGFTGRAVDPDTQPKVRDYYGLPKRQLILGEERWQADRPILLVEGLFGYAHLVGIGVERLCNVGALLGSVLTSEKAQRVLLYDASVFLLLDNDAAGDIGLFGPILSDGSRDEAGGAVHQLRGYVPVHVPVWPEGKDDPDQLTYGEVEEILAETPAYIS